jgi:hypothetical protein
MLPCKAIRRGAVSLFLLLLWLGFLDSAKTFGQKLHLVTLVASDGRQHVVGYLALMEPHGKNKEIRRRPRQNKSYDASQSSQVHGFRLCFRGLGAEVDRTRSV